jgi:nucleotide-binding universal stress UspA family protein
MRVIIAYDGSEGSQAALGDLERAGLGKDVEATILSIAEVWLPPPQTSLGIDEPFPPYTPPEVRSWHEIAVLAIEQMRLLANEANARLRSVFPSWKVSTEVRAGSPWWEAVRRANELESDLIVVGSHGRSALGRFFLGSVSQKILTDARCSVRLGRKSAGAGASAHLLLVGVDGSPDGEAAVHELAKREWPSGIRIHVISVKDPSVPLALGSLNPQISKWAGDGEEGDRQWVEKMVEASAEHLRQAGFDVSAEVKEGDAKEVLMDQAQRLGADCIFVGSSGLSNRLERFVLGSVSTAVANRADCSVEVVRPRAES